MIPRFELLEEGWIPCLPLSGGPPVSLGLRATLERAAALQEITHPSPLVTASIHRLLLAVLHRVFGPEDEDAWAALWERGGFDVEALDGYLTGDRCRGRFDLFDQRRPFYQVGSLDFSYGAPVSVLIHPLAAGNNTTLFDHSTDRNPSGLAPDEAALALLAYHAYAVGGLISFEKGQDRNRYGSATAAPLVKGAVALIRGDTLFRTLLLNLVRYCPEENAPFRTIGEDSPAWERDEETVPEERRPAGYLDLLTWQSRRVRLQPEVDGGGRLVVRHAVAMKGHQFPASFTRREAETMVAFGRNPKAAAGADPYPPVGFQPDRALWRDSLALVEAAGAHPQPEDVRPGRPRTLTWLADLIDAQKLERARTLPLDLLGLAADRAKVLLWRHERLPLPLVYLNDAALRREMRRALEVAESVGWRVLRLSARELAVRLLAPHADEAGGRQPDLKRVQQVADGLAAERLYWWRLEVPFTDFLLDLPQAVAEAPDDDPPGRTAIAAWRDDVAAAARRAFEDVARGLDTSARTLQALGSVERRFGARLRRELDHYLKEEGREGDRGAAPIGPAPAQLGDARDGGESA